MASYFDPQPSSQTTAEVFIEPPKEDGVDHPSSKPAGFEEDKMILTLQVSRIIEEIDQSSSDDELNSSDTNSDPSHFSANPTARHDSQSSTQPESKTQSKVLPDEKQKHVKLVPPRPSVGPLASGQKHPHMARFHSLRSMLFSSHLADAEAKCKAEKETEWKEEHEKRKGLNRPKTPEGSPTKEGFVERLGRGIKKVTNRELPTIKKEQSQESSASSDEEVEGMKTKVGKQLESGNESLDYEDIDELVKWVSQRDMDGRSWKKGVKMEAASSKLDGQLEGRNEYMSHSDVDELVLWVSRRDNDGDLQRKMKGDEEMPSSRVKLDQELGSGNESLGYGDLKRVSQQDGTSGEWSPENEPDEVLTASDSEGQANKHASLGHRHVDELVRWMSRKDKAKDGRSEKKSENETLKAQLKGEHGKNKSLCHEDVDELLRWMGRGDEDEVSTASESDDEPRGRQGKRHGSLGNEDVDELVKWVSRRQS
ncbi:hypothetical protein K469DRAFT_235856 [Zopfia rhizophila CBS 207.26]|uniref:Uncharacterized protein n=1 Tax=Zopfia rhizophila CBS 207.26 TaxID=1314779 RepID=A0A6A6EU63_9PEZI|nr:hypothetical protein K469DRAFT_235856 [Zopfia rhizophila CBS 207.26]